MRETLQLTKITILKANYKTNQKNPGNQAISSLDMNSTNVNNNLRELTQTDIARHCKEHLRMLGNKRKIQ